MLQVRFGSVGAEYERVGIMARQAQEVCVCVCVCDGGKLSTPPTADTCDLLGMISRAERGMWA